LQEKARIVALREVIYVGPDNDEVMVWMDDAFNPKGAYVFRDSPLLRFDPQQYEQLNQLEQEQVTGYRWRWKAGHNPLFLHARTKAMNTFLWWVETIGYSYEEEEEPHPSQPG
jgi:hypothetical protein